MKDKTGSITLRAIQEKDLLLLNQLINDPEINKKTVGESKPVTMKQQYEWFKGLKDSKDIRFIVADDDDNALGTCIICEVDNNNKNCEIGIKLARSAQGKGIGTEAIKRAVDYAFRHLNMHRIYARILEDNIASRKLFEKIGFVFEGKQRQAVFKNGKYNDLCLYGLLEEDYLHERNR